VRYQVIAPTENVNLGPPCRVALGESMGKDCRNARRVEQMLEKVECRPQ
jgi:hypothetical protein